LKPDPETGDEDESNSLAGLRFYREEFSRQGFEANPKYEDHVAIGRVFESGDKKC
jgi:hypothetical protein